MGIGFEDCRGQTFEAEFQHSGKLCQMAKKVRGTGYYIRHLLDGYSALSVNCSFQTVHPH